MSGEEELQGAWRWTQVVKSWWWRWGRVERNSADDEYELWNALCII